MRITAIISDIKSHYITCSHSSYCCDEERPCCGGPLGAHDQTHGADEDAGPWPSAAELPGNEGRVHGHRDWRLHWRCVFLERSRDEEISRMSYVKSFLP